MVKFASEEYYEMTDVPDVRLTMLHLLLEVLVENGVNLHFPDENDDSILFKAASRTW